MIYGMDTVEVRCACGKTEMFPRVFPVVFHCDCATTIIESLADDADDDNAEALAAG